MRVLALLLKFLGGVAVAAVIGFFALREVAVAILRWQFSNETAQLQGIAKQPTNFARLCADTYPTSAGAFALTGVQLRFTNDRQYGIEIVCRANEANPLAIGTKSTNTLPLYAKKVPGSAGLFLSVSGLANTSFTVDIFGRKTEIAIRDTEPNQDIAQKQPIAMCTGWGYQCCDELTQVPDGARAQSGVLDCPQSCSATCKSRPLVLSFRSEPFFDQETRVLTTHNAQETVTFYYSTSDSDGTVDRLVLDYGDGQREKIGEAQGSLSHEYTCNTATCAYVATMMVVDNDGLVSPNLRTSSITVKMGVEE